MKVYTEVTVWLYSGWFLVLYPSGFNDKIPVTIWGDWTLRIDRFGVGTAITIDQSSLACITFTVFEQGK
jgi:hypothetical protein